MTVERCFLSDNRGRRRPAASWPWMHTNAYGPAAGVIPLPCNPQVMTSDRTKRLPCGETNQWMEWHGYRRAETVTRIMPREHFIISSTVSPLSREHGSGPLIQNAVQPWHEHRRTLKRPRPKLRQAQRNANAVDRSESLRCSPKCVAGDLLCFGSRSPVWMDCNTSRRSKHGASCLHRSLPSGQEMSSGNAGQHRDQRNQRSEMRKR